MNILEKGEIELKKEIEVMKCKIVITKDELGYSEVLEHFPTAEFIYIVTYNISSKNPTLLNKLKEVSDGTEVKIFTNIPSRYENYYYGASSKAQVQIDNYLTKLDPEQFSKLFSSYFVFNNHGKIIMTDSIAYIGSSNFSSESANSIEAGVIIEDEQVILKLKELINQEIQSVAESYYEFDILPLIFLSRELEQIRTIISENIWGMWDIHGVEQGQYYKGHNINLDMKIIEVFEDTKEEINNVLSELIDKIEDEYMKEPLPIVKQLIYIKDLIVGYELEQEVIDFLEFDELDYVDDLIEENSIVMTEDVLDDYVQEFTQNAFEIKEEYADDAQEGFIEFEAFLTESIRLLLDITEKLRSYTNQTIDNTR